MVSSSVRVKESHEQHAPLVFMEKGHRVTLEYVALYDRLMKGR